MKKIKKFITFALIFFSAVAFAQQAVSKNPKVVEIEKALTKDASSFLQQRFPNEPFFVDIEIEPLRRTSGDKADKLPYFFSEDEEGDEWDIIDTPLSFLQSRIKKAVVKVEISNSISDAEVSDLKEKLYQQLKLIPGRDSISIEKKVMPEKASTSKNLLLYYFLSAMTLVILIGLFFIVKFGMKNRPQSAPSASASATSAASPMPSMSSGNSSANKYSGPQAAPSAFGGAQDVNFSDKFKVSELLKDKLSGIVNAPVFPMISDMLVLEELAEKSPSSFGAFVFELPRKSQQKVFFRGRSEKWFKGYIDVGSPDLDCLLTAEKMLRNRTPSGLEQWEELLIQVWRLGNDSLSFLKKIPSDEAFSILSHLPKTFSVPIAKKAFPGSWAKLLENNNLPPINDLTKLQSYLEKTLETKPYFNFQSIDDYKKDLELVDYLKTASVKDEEEIYESLSEESLVHSIRPPFYNVFKATPEDFKIIFAQFSINEWAIAVFNTDRALGKVVTKELDEKKKYLFSMLLKGLDESPPQSHDMIEIREAVARAYKDYMTQKKSNLLELKAKESEKENEDEDSNAA